MKIGIYYSVTAKGFDSKSVKINGGTWCEVVDDYRDDWQRYTSTTEGVGVAMKIVKDGVVFAVIQMLKGSDRPDNNVTTWVYIPNKLTISGTQINEIISAVREINKLPTKNITENTFLEKPAIGQDYQEKRYACSVMPSKGENMAARYPANRFSMAEIYGKPFQSYYAKYKFVFLYEEKTQIAEDLVDLSNEELVDSICVLRPSEANIEALFGVKDVRIQSEEGVLEQIMCKNKGERLHMTASRQGYVPISFLAEAKNDGEELDMIVSPIPVKWKKIISDDSFKVIDSKNDRSLCGARIDMSSDPYYDNQTKSIPEDRLSGVKVRVTCQGYDTFDDTVDLTKWPVEIRLKKTVETAKYSYTNSKGEDLSVTIEGPGAKSASPLKGYYAQGNKLIYDNPTPIYYEREPKIGYGNNGVQHHSSHKKRFAWLEFCYGIIAACVVALLFWGFVALCSWYSNNTFEWQFGWPPLKIEKTSTPKYNPVPDDNMTGNPNPNQGAGEDAPTINSEVTIEDAIAYLDNKFGVWERDSLIKYPELDGLFEELNSYDFNKIRNRLSKISDSKNFKRVYEAIQENSNKQFTGQFCGDNDFSITVENYIKKLNKPVNQPQTPSNGGVASDAAKKVQKSSKNTPTEQPNSANNTNKKRGGV